MIPPGELRRRIMGDDREELPDWVIVAGEVRTLVDRLRSDVADAVRRFEQFDDVEMAISYRERHVPRLRGRVGEINRRIAYLNLVVPHMRFQRAPLNADAEVAPLSRSYFRRR